MNLIFPSIVGDVLGGKTFEDVWQTDCKTIEFVRKCWDPEKCTDLFLEFYKFVMLKMQNPENVKMHEERCKEYVKEINDIKDIPRYLSKYK